MRRLNIILAGLLARCSTFASTGTDTSRTALLLIIFGFCQPSLFPRRSFRFELTRGEKQTCAGTATQRRAEAAVTMLRRGDAGIALYLNCRQSRVLSWRQSEWPNSGYLRSAFNSACNLSTSLRSRRNFFPNVVKWYSTRGGISGN
jgi:hypothetical protein